jgi:hypothetical protein
MTVVRRIALTAIAALTSALALPAMGQPVAMASSDAWTWRFALNGWLPSLGSSTQLDLPGGGNIAAEADPSGYLSKLKFAFMGTLEARRGPWSFLADALYLNLGDVRSKVRSVTGPGGIVTIPIDNGTRTDLKGFIGTFEGGYAILQTPGARADFVAGLRYANLKTRVDWELSGPTGGVANEGGVEATKDVLDGVVGVRGKVDLGGNWDFRYYVDAGAGSSQFTWQALAGIGYRFGWGDVVFGYRHLAYEFNNDRPIADVRFSGPEFVVGFKF